ncbi:MAG: hypothetical protein KTR33_09750 [Gammaproteobacteria bacterium]|nr:hypothetical protein [Gammaproteobacteria bacterium]
MAILLLLLLRFGFALLYVAVTLFVVASELPEAEKFAVDASFTIGMQFLTFLVIALVQLSRTRDAMQESRLFVRQLSLSSAFALPTLVTLYYGAYALPLLVWSAVALTTELLQKERVSREFMIVALIGCAIAVVVAL